MRAALRLADARLAHPEASNLLRLYLPMPVATDCASDIPPTTKELLPLDVRVPHLARSPR
eukprot:13305422-Alexandrium_andersonii.AAC.1